MHTDLNDLLYVAAVTHTGSLARAAQKTFGMRRPRKNTSCHPC